MRHLILLALFVVTAGQTLDFVVGDGDNGQDFDDSIHQHAHMDLLPAGCS